MLRGLTVIMHCSTIFIQRMNDTGIVRVQKRTNAPERTLIERHHLAYRQVADHGVDRGTLQQTEYHIILNELTC